MLQIDYSMVELKRKGVGQITPDEEMLWSASNGGELVVVVGDSFGDVAYMLLECGGEFVINGGQPKYRHGW